MKYGVVIYKANGGWLFCWTKGNQVTRTQIFSRLIEALEYASALGLHVDNADELPINQYFKTF